MEIIGSEWPEELRLDHYDVDPTECSVRRCITPDAIGCIMGYVAKAPSSPSNAFAAVFSRPEEGSVTVV